jgi:UDP-N-acetylglucosamine--N-acetylmuramyl-(pentapeptide) pyrophosphoryl-undecaprenol N-acetylglucosamine transferase
VFQVIHITGKNNFEEIKNEYEKNSISLNQNIKLLDYCEEMHKIYAAVDLIISRSGASTISELLYLKKPAILIPLPSSAGGHQKENAKILSETGAAVLFEETDNFEDDFAKNFKEILDNPELINKMKLSYDKINIPDIINASSTLADLIDNLLATPQVDSV